MKPFCRNIQLLIYLLIFLQDREVRPSSDVDAISIVQSEQVSDDQMLFMAREIETTCLPANEKGHLGSFIFDEIMPEIIIKLVENQYGMERSEAINEIISQGQKVFKENNQISN